MLEVICFLWKKGQVTHRAFGLYFDTKAYDYEMADMFSLSYWQENKRLMTEQQKYEEGGTGISRMENDDENNVVLYPMSNNGDFKVFINNNSTADIQIVEIGSGRVVYSDKLVKRGEAVVIHLAGILLPGIYTVRIQTPESVVVKRMVVSHML
ncbi:T9SS type A sorting domain-containing protein [Bacteroides salyersiae]|nr:T9SS type A sorting domain-containing protein [Bacteroides salyersiae]